MIEGGTNQMIFLDPLWTSDGTSLPRQSGIAPCFRKIGFSGGGVLVHDAIPHIYAVTVILTLNVHVLRGVPGTWWPSAGSDLQSRCCRSPCPLESGKLDNT